MTTALRAAVLGFPIAHSLSPQIHNHWISQLGMEGNYEARAVPPTISDLSRALNDLQAQGYNGCNLTVPLKELVMQLPGYKPDARVAQVGAANTVSFHPAPHLDNTDVFGVEHSLQAMGARTGEGGRVLLFGAGGAARAAACWAHACGKEITIANRSVAKAEQLCRSMHITAQILPLNDSRALQQAYRQHEIIIQSTSIELDPTADVSHMLPTCDLTGTLFLDMVYRRVPVSMDHQTTSTRWSLAAAAQGAVAEDGLRMLVAQAAQAFSIWTDREPAIATTLEWLRASLR